MENHDFFLARLEDSVVHQSFKDYELIVTYEGKMAENTNAAMRKAKGKYIKILYLDDYLASPNALANIAHAFEREPEKYWLASGCYHDNGKERYLQPHLPYWNGDMLKGNNTIGSPSVVSIRNGLDMYFDERLSWLLDCDLYHRMAEKFGPPGLINEFDVGIGVGQHQTSYIMSEVEKQLEADYITNKYDL